jgi:dihydrofolate reductase
MGIVIYSFQASADGYIEDREGKLDWALVDEKLHRHFNDQERSTETLLYGRRLSQLMANDWPTADRDPELPDYMRECAEIWKSKPKIVFSSTLNRVQSNSRLSRDSPDEEVARLKEPPGARYSVGGGILAASLIERGMFDEHWMQLNPVILGGGKPIFPSLRDRIQPRLAESRTFSDGVVLLR